MNDKDKKVVDYIAEYVKDEIIRTRNSAYRRNGTKIRIDVEQALLSNTEIFEMMTEPVLRELLKKKYALKWDYIAKLECLSEEFITEYYKGLSPMTILTNYPDLSDETKELFYPYIGVLSRLKMRIKLDETEEEIIANYSKYGKKLKKKIINYIKLHEDELPASLVLFTKLSV